MQQRGSAGRGAGTAGRKRNAPPGTARAAPGAAPGSGGLNAHVLILPFVFSFVVLSFCNPETLRVSLQPPPLLLQTVAGRGGQAPCLFRARDTAGKPEDSTSPFVVWDFPASPLWPWGKCPPAPRDPGAWSDTGASVPGAASTQGDEEEEEDALPRCQDADNCAGRKLANPIYYYYYYYYYNYFNFFVTFLFL